MSAAEVARRRTNVKREMGVMEAMGYCLVGRMDDKEEANEGGYIMNIDNVDVNHTKHSTPLT